MKSYASIYFSNAQGETDTTAWLADMQGYSIHAILKSLHMSQRKMTTLCSSEVLFIFLATKQGKQGHN